MRISLRLMLLFCLLSTLACTEAIPVVTATVSSRKVFAGKKHFIFGRAGQQLKIYEVNTASGTTVRSDSFTFAHPIADYQILNNQKLLVDDGTAGLHVYEIQKNDEWVRLQHLSSASAAVGSTTSGICAAPDGSSVQLIRAGLSSIFSFKLSADGIATYANVSATPSYVVQCVSTSKFVFAAGYSGDKIETYSVDTTTKALSSIAYFPLGSGERIGPSSMALTEDQSFLFLTEQLKDRVSAFAVNKDTGALTLLHSAYACPQPNFMQPYFDGQRLLMNCQNAGQAIIEFDKTTGLFGTRTQISTTSIGFFHISKFAQTVYQKRQLNIDIKKIKDDGLLASASQVVPVSSDILIRSFEIEY